MEDATGGCLCGAVRYRVRAPLRNVVNCHCGQCRRWHGHVGAYTEVPREAVELTESRGLKWFQSSAHARRAFCAECGSSLFWDALKGAEFGIAAGTLDGPTGLETVAHIFTKYAGDYYRIDDGLPKSSRE